MRCSIMLSKEKERCGEVGQGEMEFQWEAAKIPPPPRERGFQLILHNNTINKPYFWVTE